MDRDFVEKKTGNMHRPGNNKSGSIPALGHGFKSLAQEFITGSFGDMLPLMERRRGRNHYPSHSDMLVTQTFAGATLVGSKSYIEQNAVGFH